MLKLTNVKIDWPALWEKKAFDETSTPKYEATFMVPKDSKDVPALLAAVQEAKDKFGKKIPDDKVFAMADGDESEVDRYKGHWIVKAKNKGRVKVEDRRRDPVTEDDELIYAGATVTALIRVYGPKPGDKFKYVSAQLLAVQFVSHGEPFGPSVNLDEYFEDLGDDDADY